MYNNLIRVHVTSNTVLVLYLILTESRKKNSYTIVIVYTYFI